MTLSQHPVASLSVARRARAPRVLAAAGLMLLILSACIASSSLSACSDDPSTAGKSPLAAPKADAAATFPFTVTDSSGTMVSLSEQPKRIISYSPAVTESLFAVGAGSQLVAVDKFSDYPDGTKSLPKLEYSKPSPEPALGYAPDLVFMSARQEGQAPQFRGLGMKVILLKEPMDLAAVAEQVELLGKITGNVPAGTKAATDIRARMAKVVSRVAAIGKGPKVFFELDPAGFTVAQGSFIGSMLAIVKAGNVAAGATSQFPQLSLEAIIAGDPDVILLADGGDTGGQTADMVRARPGWSGIAAVRAGRVYVVDGNTFSRPGPRVVEALEALVKQLYPDLK